MMDEPVVPATEQHEVVQGRRPTVGPVDDMVGIAPALGSVATGKAAVTIANDHRTTHRSRHGRCPPADVERLGASGKAPPGPWSLRCHDRPVREVEPLATDLCPSRSNSFRRSISASLRNRSTSSCSTARCSSAKSSSMRASGNSASDSDRSISTADRSSLTSQHIRTCVRRYTSPLTLRRTNERPTSPQQ